MSWSNVLRAAVLMASMVPVTTGCEITIGGDKDKKSKKKKGKDKKGKDGISSDEDTVGDGAGGVPEADEYLADTGFRPSKHGFRFKNGDYTASGKKRNYPDTSPGHLDVDGMQRLFTSEKVCLGLERGQTDAFALASNGYGLTYKPGADKRNPKVRLAVDAEKSDYMLDLSDFGAKNGKSLTFTVDPDKLSLNVKDEGVDTSDFDFAITRYALDGKKKTFKKKDLPSGRGLTGGGDLSFGDLE